MQSSHGWKAAQTLNGQPSFNLEIMLYKLELGHNAARTTENIWYVKGQMAVISVQ